MIRSGIAYDSQGIAWIIEEFRVTLDDPLP